ncbi:MAG: zf-HC2 domain-containing protein [Deltaproteobacteria bacterium]|nr:zf-HC2 domain-containing protein [Deltaproteobacteria bacterium]
MVEATFQLGCRDEQELIELFLDGELGAEEQRELEAHLEDCEVCRHHLEERAQVSARLLSAASEVKAPASLGERVAAALDSVDFDLPPTAEDERLFGPPPGRDSKVVPLAQARWTRRLPVMASAAALALFVWVAGGGFGASSSSEEDLVEDAVTRHARALPLELDTPDPAQVRGWARGKVDFNPRVPHFRSALQPVGARLSHVLDRPAVYLAYQEPGGGRAGLFLFAEGEHPHLPVARERVRRVGDHEVVLVNRRGYNVVMWRDQGIVYSLVSDLDESTLLRLVDAGSR